MHQTYSPFFFPHKFNHLSDISNRFLQDFCVNMKSIQVKIKILKNTKGFVSCGTTPHSVGPQDRANYEEEEFLYWLCIYAHRHSGDIVQKVM